MAGLYHCCWVHCRVTGGGGGKPRPQPHTVPYAPLPLFTGRPCPWSQPTETLVTGPLGKGWASRMLFSNDGVITAVPMQESLTGPRSLLSSGNKDRGANLTVAIFMPLSCPPPPRVQVAHAPGLALTETLLTGPLGKGWASRVFFSDDGSTAVEVALKMAFRKYMVDHGLTSSTDNVQLEVRTHQTP
jgi:hypothetical protein